MLCRALNIRLGAPYRKAKTVVSTKTESSLDANLGHPPNYDIPGNGCDATDVNTMNAAHGSQTAIVVSLPCT